MLEVGNTARMYGLTPRELRLLRSLDTPVRVQKFLDSIPYNTEDDGVDTLRSPRRVIRDRTAHCAEGALFAAAAFRVNGKPPLLIDLESTRDDDHVLAPYRERGLWGAVATSKFAGLRFRAPVYRTVRELVMSYFEDYYNWAGERTLRGFAGPISLTPFDRDKWMTSEADVWSVVEHLARIKHTPLIPKATAGRLPRLDRRSYASGVLGAPKRH